MSQNPAPVLRFAPSPTGYLHIGGARTALFNWLFARHTGGRFLLRIEDTDRERSTPEAVAAILNGLAWLGLDWDGDVVYQFARAARHREIAEQMLGNGHAYRCYATPQELDEMRARQRAEGKPMRYDGRWRDRPMSDAPAGAPFAVRLKAPQTGETFVNDVVQGEVRFANEQLDDMVLLRADGTPTYMLAVVVDDYDMGVTHIVRGVDHLTNAARQLQIIQAMGWPIPVYGHVPLIHGPDGAKLSKRHGALAAEAYRDMGYLPEAMRNYLLRLGWASGDEEIIPTARAIDLSGPHHCRWGSCPLARRDARPQGAREDLGRALRRRRVPVFRRTPRSRYRGSGRSDTRCAQPAQEAARRVAGRRLGRGRDRGARARIRRHGRREARRRSSAVARSAHGPYHVAAGFRCARRARPRRISQPNPAPRRIGLLVMKPMLYSL
jgi:hypothetical protein